MQIDLVCDNLVTRIGLRETWTRAGARVGRPGELPPDLFVVDLTARQAVDNIAVLRQRWPEVEIVAFGPHIDAGAFQAARAAGATRSIARGKVAERILGRLREAPAT